MHAFGDLVPSAPLPCPSVLQRGVQGRRFHARAETLPSVCGPESTGTQCHRTCNALLVGLLQPVSSVFIYMSVCLSACERELLFAGYSPRCLVHPAFEAEAVGRKLQAHGHMGSRGQGLELPPAVFQDVS